jgi:tetratricopeptide (TPR) repeat protein
MKSGARLALATLLACLGVAVAAQPACPQFTFVRQAGAFGPEDYRGNRQKSLVEDFHFTADVENLRRGRSSTVGGDIAYTLSVFPNHPRALIAADRYAQKEKVAIPEGLKYTPACYYERALQFRPDDHPVRLLYTLLLLRNKQTDLAMQHASYVETNSLDNPITQHNVGLIFLDMGEVDKAVEAARRAYELGATQPLLRDRLQAMGRWPAPAAPAPAASAPQ